MRVLWLCNRALADEDAGATGTWLDAMARALLDSGAVELGIIGAAAVPEFTRRDYRQVKQWLVPAGTKLGPKSLPSAALISSIVTAVHEFAPNIVHIWGTEWFWGLLTARDLLNYPALLEIQGLKGECAKVFYGGLTSLERMGCIGVKEVPKRDEPCMPIEVTLLDGENSRQRSFAATDS